MVKKVYRAYMEGNRRRGRPQRRWRDEVKDLLFGIGCVVQKEKMYIVYIYIYIYIHYSSKITHH